MSHTALTPLRKIHLPAIVIIISLLMLMLTTWTLYAQSHQDIDRFTIPTPVHYAPQPAIKQNNTVQLSQ